MTQITHQHLNKNGVCIYKCKYLGGGLYELLITAEKVEIGDVYVHSIGPNLTVVEIKDQKQSKGDKSLVLYDLLVKDEYFQTESNYCKFPSI